jgi:hypothetical protein
VSFHYGSGWKCHPIENVNRIHRPSADGLAHTVDSDPAFKSDTKGNAGWNQRP